MILPLHELTSPFHFETIFGRTAPVEIEIGVGKGLFLKNQASAFPDRNFLGIEQSLKWILFAQTRLQNAGISNIRLIQGYAEKIIPNFIPDSSITSYHIYFPDPWPKRRHRKRRIFQSAFIAELIRTLTPDGEVRIATDHKDYYSIITDTFNMYSRNQLNLFMNAESDLQTHYRAKYQQEGREIAYLSARKTV